MEQITQKDLITNKIAELVKKAPHDWASRIADAMGKTEVTIYAYARGERGVRRGYPIEVLRQLTAMINKQQKEIEKLIS